MSGLNDVFAELPHAEVADRPELLAEVRELLREARAAASDVRDALREVPEPVRPRLGAMYAVRSEKFTFSGLYSL